jgi:hypothetical protein
LIVRSFSRSGVRSSFTSSPIPTILRILPPERTRIAVRRVSDVATASKTFLKPLMKRSCPSIGLYRLAPVSSDK